MIVAFEIKKGDVQDLFTFLHPAIKSDTITLKAIKLIDTEAQIKAAAKTVFFKRGLAGARMQEIAQVAGIGRTTLNYYYSSKEKLFQVMWKEAFRSIAVRTEALRNNNYSTLEKMDAFVDGYFDHAVISMCLFSFAGRAVIQNLLSLNNEQYMELMKERKVHLKTFLKTAITTDFF